MYTTDPNTTFKYTGFNGINDQAAQHSVPTGEGEVDLTAAINVDIDRYKKLFRRQGFTAVYNGTNIRCLTPFEGGLMFADGAELKHRSSTGVVNTVHSLLAQTDTICMAEVNGDMVVSDGQEIWTVAPDLSYRILGVNPPATEPNVSASSGGSVPQGVYLVAVTMISATGEESGAPFVTEVELTDRGSIQVSNMPNSEGSVKKNVYVGVGDSLFLEATVSGASVTISSLVGGRVLQFQHKTRTPPGTHMVHTKGRLFIADGNVLWYSEPLDYGKCDMRSGFIVFPEPITMLTERLFIATDSNTYLLRGDNPDQLVLLEILKYGTPKTKAAEVEGSYLGDTGGRVEVWQSNRGICIGAEDGSIVNITDKKVAMPKYDNAATIFRRDRGINQVIATGRKSGNIDSGRMRSEFTVTVIKNNGNTDVVDIIE